MIEVELKDEEVTAALAQLQAHLEDLTPVFEQLGDALVLSTEARFAEGTAPDGTAWAPKSEATIAAYRSRKDPVDFRPLFGPSKRLSSEIAHEAGPSSLEIGSSLIYAAVQQFGASKGAFGTTSRGASIPWGDIPARPFLGISEEDSAMIVATVEDWLGSAVED